MNYFFFDKRTTHVFKAFSLKYDVTFCFQRRDLLFCCFYERSLCFCFTQFWHRYSGWEDDRVNTSAERLEAWMFQWSRTNLLSVFVYSESPSAAQDVFRRLKGLTLTHLGGCLCIKSLLLKHRVLLRMDCRFRVHFYYLVFFNSQVIDAPCLLSLIKSLQLSLSKESNLPGATEQTWLK